jgi:hypothetical protein
MLVIRLDSPKTFSARTYAARNEMSSAIAQIGKNASGELQGALFRGASQRHGRAPPVPADEAINQLAAIVESSDDAIISMTVRPGEAAELLDGIRKGRHVEHYETVRIRKDGTRVDLSATRRSSTVSATSPASP